MSTSRRQEILDAVDNLAHVHDQWEQDPNAIQFPAENFRLRLDDLAMLVDAPAGDIPGECLEIVIATTELLAEWEMFYLHEHHTSSGHPTGDFWAKYRALLQARKEAIPLVAKRIESPKLLREQKLSDFQIAKCWGARDESKNQWFGPFFDERGTVRSDLIAQEVENPGSILKGDAAISPAEKARIERTKQSVQRRMEAVRQRVESREKQRMSEYDVSRLLREGQFLSQIVKVSLWSEAEVQALAAELKIVPSRTPDLTQEPIATPSGPESPPANDSQDADTNQLIYMVTDDNPDWDSGQIAEECGVSVQKVAAVLRERKKQAETTTA